MGIIFSAMLSFLYFLRNNVTLFFIFVFYACILSVSVQASIIPEHVKAKTKAYADMLMAVNEQIDAAYYDVDSLVEKLDYDPQLATKFVTDNIHYSPYLGVMRGPEGTISTASGSSWDQAVLLADLINSMGGEAMLGLGKLKQSDAERLLKTAIISKFDVPDALADIDFESELKPPSNDLSGFPVDDAETVTLEKYRESIIQISDALIAQGKQATLFPNDNNMQTKAQNHIKQIADNYVWVRFRDTPNQAWQDVHPAFAGQYSPELEAEQYVAASVPDVQLHKISILIEIEKWSNGSYSLQPVMSEFTRPAANLAKQQIRIGIAPNVADVTTPATFYIPTINGALPEAGKAFNLQGTVYDAEDAASGPAIFQTVASQFGAALDGLAKDDGISSAPRLTGAFLSISITSPDGSVSKETRRLFDFRQAQTLPAPIDIVLNAILEVDIGQENGARDMANALDSLALSIRQLPYHMALVNKNIMPADYVLSPAFKKLASHAWTAALALNPILSPSAENGLVYRTSPLVMLRRIVKSDTAAAGLVVDIQHNHSAGFRLNSQGNIVAASDLVFQQGVKETLMEGELIGVSNVSQWLSTLKGEFVSTQEQLEKLTLWSQASASIKDRLSDDLAATGTLFVPKFGSMQNSDIRWWRINSSSGNVLGMGKYGGSQVTEEVVFENIASGVTLAGFAMGMAGGAEACSQGKASATYRLCCLAGVAILNGPLILVGGKFSGAFANKWGALLGLYSSVAFDVTGAAVPQVGNVINDSSKAVCKAVTSSD